MILQIGPTFVGLSVVAVVIIIVVFILTKKSDKDQEENNKKQHNRKQPKTEKEPKAKRNQKKKPLNYAGDGRGFSGYEGEDSSEEDLLKLHSLKSKKHTEQKVATPQQQKAAKQVQPEKEKAAAVPEKKKSKDKKVQDGSDDAEDKNYVTIKRKPQRPGQDKKVSDEETEPKDDKKKGEKSFYNKKVLKELRIEAKGGKPEDEPEEKERKGKKGKKVDGAVPQENKDDNKEDLKEKEGEEKRPPRKPRDPNAPPRPPRDPNAPPRPRRPEGEKVERVPRPVELPSLIYHEQTTSIDDMLNAITQSAAMNPGQKNVNRKPLGERPPRKPKVEREKEVKKPKEDRKDETPNVFSNLRKRYLVLRILGYLEAKDLVALSVVCRYFYRVSTVDSLWRALCLAENVKKTNRIFKLSYVRAKSTKPAPATVPANANAPPKKEWLQLPPVQKMEVV